LTSRFATRKYPKRVWEAQPFEPIQVAENIGDLVEHASDVRYVRLNCRFWNTTRDLHRRMFVGDIHGGTIVYRADMWREGSKYPDLSLAEDAAFIRHAASQGKRILRIENEGEFVYLRHACNTWRFESGRFLDPSGWRRGNAPSGFAPSILEAYRAALLRADPVRSHAS
jgi:hypothetical protein